MKTVLAVAVTLVLAQTASGADKRKAWLFEAPEGPVLAKAAPPSSRTFMAPAQQTSAAPVVAAPTFRPGSSLHHAGHNCPSCGHTSRATHVQQGTGPVPGTHWHSCPVCPARWYH